MSNKLKIIKIGSIILFLCNVLLGYLYFGLNAMIPGLIISLVALFMINIPNFLVVIYDPYVVSHNNDTKTIRLVFFGAGVGILLIVFIFLNYYYIK